MAKQRQQQQKKDASDGGTDSRSQVHDVEPLDSVAPKRKNRPRVRVVGGRIYDSELGNTCHQCRQKTLDFVATCKNVKKAAPCTVKFCHKCLMNRYGEKAEEKELLSDWNCPKCRGICNCSFCMKKRGGKPTGILVHQAKLSGFSSVSHMLKVNEEDSVVEGKKTATVTKVPVVASPTVKGKENSINGSAVSKSTEQNPRLKADKTKSKRKEEVLKDVRSTSPKKPRLHKNEGKVDMSAGVHLGKHKSAKTQGSEEAVRGATKKDQTGKEKVKKSHGAGIKNAGTNRSAPSEPDNQKVNKKIRDKASKHVKGLEECSIRAAQQEPEAVAKSTNLQGTQKSYGVDRKLDVPVPQGADLTVVAGIELPPEDVGDALQFIEFCAAFGKLLDLRKGQPECILRELINGRRGRRAQFSSVAQFHIQLLDLILKDRGEESTAITSEDGKDLWLQVFGKFISESDCSIKPLSLDSFEKGGYEKLDTSIKLKLLIFLCDEALGTMEFRTWVQDQTDLFLAEQKKAREKIFAANDKKKKMKHNLHDEIAKAVIAKNGAPLSISEHGAIVSQIKAEVDRAHLECVEAKNMGILKQHGLDAVRTDSVLSDDSGRIYWRLKGFSCKPDIVLQDLSSGKRDEPSEKWVSYKAEQKLALEEYLSFIRAKKT